MTRALALVLFCVACSSTEETKPGTDGGTDSGTTVTLGGPCAATYEDNCLVQTCLDESGNVQTETRTPITDGGCDP